MQQTKEIHGKAEAKFSYSRELFRLNNGKKVEFVILETSKDSGIVSRMIELGGGSAIVKPNPARNVINLCCYCEPWMKCYVIFNTSYVFACCSVNEKLGLREYSMGKMLSDKEFTKFEQDYLFLGKDEIHSLDKIDKKNAKELELKDIIPLKPHNSSSVYSSDGQKSSEHSPDKRSSLLENHSAGKHIIEGEKGLLPAEGCKKGSSTLCSSFKRKTCLTLSKNTAMDFSTAFEIHPKDSVSQVRGESVSSRSSSTKNSCKSSQSNYSSGSQWDRSVKMWMADDDKKNE
ncbi:hypothetical protein J437_LFUL011197 [Ladona fulva]|uniref:BRCT domain-containing protein n=1 Tax=Ladona fulva TaxID=123851 RepID=A0A8K0KRU6_LADFU|nr:hypothetical protein J437_LFUL011197 [Ladona fulva]